MEYKDYYQILGVERSATQDEIKRAYKKLARKYHPDVSKEANAEDRFKEVNEAHEVLKDPEKRAAYDQLGANWRSGQDFRPPPGWDQGFEFRGGFGDSGFSDFFENLFGAGSPFTGAGHRQQHHGFSRRGENHHASIAISLEDAYYGREKLIHLKIPTTDAHGRVSTRDHSIKVKIPKGITVGKQIRLGGQGAPGIHGGPKGDLFLKVEFSSHRLFSIDGKDTHLKLPITPWEAALGARIKVPTLGGEVEAKVPAGARSGQKLRLKGRGLPGDPPGDHFLELQVMTPPADSEQAREFYEKMARELPFNPRGHF